MPSSRTQRTTAPIEEAAPRRWRPISPQDALAAPVGIAFRYSGAPFWCEGKTNKPQQSPPEARRVRRNLIRLLRRSPDETGELIELASKLGGCNQTQPCCSGACAVCWRALRRLLVHAAQPLFGVPDRYAFATCICDEDRILCSTPLTVEAITAAERRIMDIAVVARMRIFGAIDASANEHRHRRFPPHYQLHSHFLALRGPFDRNRAEFDRCYRTSPMIHRPVEAPTFDGNARGVAYVFDAPRKRISGDPRKRRDGSWRADTNDRPLNCHQRVVMARLLDRAGIEARILLYGYELRTDGKDVWLASVSRRRADEMLAVRRREAERRLREQNSLDRRRACKQQARERYGPTLWPSSKP